MKPKVGHELAALTESRTFDSLYVEPLVKIIEGQNPKSQFTQNQTTLKYVEEMTNDPGDNSYSNLIPNSGVFDMAGDIPLQLLVDVKTNGDE